MSRPIRELLRRISDQIRDERGQSLIIISFLFVGLVALVGLAVDLGTMYVERTKLGQAIDAAALAGAQELPNQGAAWDRALEFLKMNGYDPTDVSLQLTHTFPDVPVHVDEHYQIQIEATKSVPLNFMRVLGFKNVTVSASAVGENANRLDLVLVLDRTGSMVVDTCNITRTSPQYACNPWLTNITNLFSDNFNSGLTGWTTNSTATWQSGGYVRLEGASTTAGQGQFTRQFSTLGRDVVKVTFRVRMTGMSGNDTLQLIWRRGPSGTIQTAWSAQPPPTNWQQIQYELPTGAADISNLVVGFRLRSTEPGEYAYIDDFTLDAANDGVGSYDGKGGNNNSCDGGWGQDCGDSPDPFQNYFHEQPIYDTLLAADNFLDHLDPDMDLVGLVTYSTSSMIAIELSSDLDAITDTLYAIEPSGWTNISDAILSGVDALSTTSPHHGRSNAVKVMILLTDGWSNSWYDEAGHLHQGGCPGSGCCDSVPSPCNCKEGTTELWGRTRAAWQWARDNGIIIFVIGQSDCPNTSLMEEIATGTFGEYYWAPTTDQLEGVFNKIAEHLFLRLVR